jgi:hypothetical protein
MTRWVQHRPCLGSKWHHFPFIVHYFWPGPIGVWSKEMHYIGNRLLSGMHTKWYPPVACISVPEEITLDNVSSSPLLFSTSWTTEPHQTELNQSKVPIHQLPVLFYLTPKMHCFHNPRSNGARPTPMHLTAFGRLPLHTEPRLFARVLMSVRHVRCATNPVTCQENIYVSSLIDEPIHNQRGTYHLFLLLSIWYLLLFVKGCLSFK